MMWTEVQDETLKTMLAGGATASAAAAALGVTRGAAMGRAHRQGFAMNAPNTGGWGAERMKEVRAARKERAAKAERRNPFLYKASSQPKPPRPMVQRPSAAAPSLRLTLLELNANDCHYVAGDDHLYCGQPAEEFRPYCPGHMRIMYQPVRARGV
jgi:hypothetical protein